jgi:hypothetical protein
MTTQIAWQRHAGTAMDEANGFTVVDCDACGVEHIVPISTAGELAHVNGHESYATEKPLYIQRHLGEIAAAGSCAASRRHRKPA